MPFYIRTGSGRPKTRPISSFSGRLIQILMDLDQSNAPGALAWSGSIRSVGLGRRSLGYRFFCDFLNFLAICTAILANWTCCMPNFIKMPRFFLLIGFLLFSWWIVIFYTWNLNKKYAFALFVLTCVRFVVFSAFRMRCSCQFCVMCLRYLMCVLCDILQFC